MNRLNKLKKIAALTAAVGVCPGLVCAESTPFLAVVDESLSHHYPALSANHISCPLVLRNQTRAAEQAKARRHHG